MCPLIFVYKNTFLCMTWLISRWNRTHSCLQVFLFMGIGTIWYHRIQYSFLFVTWIISMWDMTHSYLQVFLFMGIGTIWYYRIKDSFLFVAWFISMCVMTHFAFLCASVCTDGNRGNIVLRRQKFNFMCDIAHSYLQMFLLMGISTTWYGVALVSRLDKITGLFCKRAL